MNSKFYVSLKAEELLIEKGYPIEKDTPIYNEYGDAIGFYPADRPTKSEAIDWLDTKEIVIEISSVRNRKWRFSIYKNGWFQIDSWIHDRLDFSTRLEAEDAAIIKALELL